MQRSHYLPTLVVAAVSGVLGGAMTKSSNAQYIPQDNLQRNQQSSSVEVVPAGGLRYVNQSGRTIAVLGEEAGAGAFTLLDQNGNPAITLLAGTGGRVVVNTRSSAVVELGGAEKQYVVRLSSGHSASIKLGETTQVSHTQDGGRFQMGDQSGRMVFSVASTPEGSRLAGFDKKGQASFDLLATVTGGEASLRNKDGDVGFRANGEGTATVLRDKKAVWKVPQEEGG